jgi:uncharacterized protein (UPF0261 family)
MAGPVRFLIPEGGVSAIDKPGQPFHDAEADRALFAAIESGFRPSSTHRLVKLPLHVNDEAFADALVAAWGELAALAPTLSRERERERRNPYHPLPLAGEGRGEGR